MMEVCLLEIRCKHQEIKDFGFFPFVEGVKIACIGSQLVIQGNREVSRFPHSKKNLLSY